MGRGSTDGESEDYVRSPGIPPPYRDVSPFWEVVGGAPVYNMRSRGRGGKLDEVPGLCVSAVGVRFFDIPSSSGPGTSPLLEVGMRISSKKIIFFLTSTIDKRIPFLDEFLFSFYLNTVLTLLQRTH